MEITVGLSSDVKVKSGVLWEELEELGEESEHVLGDLELGLDVPKGIGDVRKTCSEWLVHIQHRRVLVPGVRIGDQSEIVAHCEWTILEEDGLPIFFWVSISFFYARKK